MLFYPSKNNNALNGDLFTPEMINGRVMVNPYYPVDIAPDTDTLYDSCAFQECAPWLRHLPWFALDRQLEFHRRITRRCGRHRATFMIYDQLTGVDEAIDEHGRRVKRRGTHETAAAAVAETIRNAHYYHSQRERIPGAIGYAAQGIDPDQYLACTEQLVPLIRPGYDLFAFGGFCIIGQKPKLKPVFYETLRRVLPHLEASGVHRAHILGVTVSDAIMEAASIARPYNIVLSTDSSGPERNAAVYGKEFVTDRGRPRFVAKYSKADKMINYRPAAWAMENIRRYHEWCETLVQKEYAYAAD